MSRSYTPLDFLKSLAEALGSACPRLPRSRSRKIARFLVAVGQYLLSTKNWEETYRHFARHWYRPTRGCGGNAAQARSCGTPMKEVEHTSLTIQCAKYMLYARMQQSLLPYPRRDMMSSRILVVHKMKAW